MAALAAPLIMGMSSVGSAATQANALRAQGAYQKQISETNAAIASGQADDAVSRGGVVANQIRRHAEKVKGEQRAAAAGAGVSVDSGDTADLATETELAANQDAKTSKVNAFRAAFGFETAANNATAQGKFAQMGAENQARNTLLTGGMQALAYGMDASSKRKTINQRELG